eukprot:3477745-Amphidinium_carterae.1
MRKASQRRRGARKPIRTSRHDSMYFRIGGSTPTPPQAPDAQPPKNRRSSPTPPPRRSGFAPWNRGIGLTLQTTSDMIVSIDGISHYSPNINYYVRRFVVRHEINNCVKSSI